MTLRRLSAPQRVGDLLTRALPALTERMFEDTIRREWAVVAGPELSRRSRPGTLERGVLEVCADNSPWLTELTLRSGELLAALGARYGGRITSLRCVLGPVAREAPGPAQRARRAPGPGERRLSAEEAQAVETAVATLPDPDLAAALRRLMTKDCLARRQRAADPRAEGPAT
ncbi:MAG: DUF721 domain-containing protein [Candidatus Rokubacteria bacterium]|nr:DUF721 domain-containing protein [Candidatus Rokubacteria bacterium]